MASLTRKLKRAKERKEQKRMKETRKDNKLISDGYVVFEKIEGPSGDMVYRMDFETEDEMNDYFSQFNDSGIILESVNNSQKFTEEEMDNAIDRTPTFNDFPDEKIISVPISKALYDDLEKTCNNYQLCPLYVLEDAIIKVTQRIINNDGKIE